MKNKLKFKILAGFMLLVALLMTAGAVSILEFIKLSKSVDALIEDNYKTIEVSRTMLEALERKDSGILLLILGQREEGKEIIRSAEKAFDEAFKIAKNNITETNEDKYIENIERLYSKFKVEIDEIIFDKSRVGDIGWYQGEIYQTFLEVKHAVDELMKINQNSMYSEASILKEKSHRAIMPGIVAIVGGLVFSLILSFFISRYYVKPLTDLTEAIKTFHPREKNLRSNIKTEDEIKKIEVEVNNLIARLAKNRDVQ
jgi:methyl-accepting chemotaxis protein